MPTIDQRLRRQRRDLLQRMPHLRVSALDHAAAAHREERISSEGYAPLAAGVRGKRSRNEVRHLTARVAGRADRLNLERAEGDAVAILHRNVDAGYIGGFLRWSEDFAARFALQAKMPLGMIVMVMGRENMCELEARPLQGFTDRAFLRRID